MMLTSRPRFWALAILFGALAVGAALYCFAPENTSWFPVCVFYKLTGLYCPGCGTARSLHHLLHGDLAGACRSNILMVLCLPLVGQLLVSQVVLATSGRTLKPLPMSGRAAWLILAVIMLYWVARNIPVYPLTLLAPH